VSRLGKAMTVVAAAVIATGLLIGVTGLAHVLRPSPPEPTVRLATPARVTKAKAGDPATLCLRLFDASDAAPADAAAIRALAVPGLAAQLLKADATRPPHFRGPAAKVLTEQTGPATAEILGPDFELVCTISGGKVTALGSPK